MDEPKDSLALSNLLLCHESESSLNQEEDEDDTIKRSEQEMIGEEEFVVELVGKENHRFQLPIKTTSSSLDRLIAINWILTTRTRFGFQHQTAYIAISYFDLFLQRRFIGRDESWAIRLLSVGCLSLAAKMEERNVPGLSQYPQDQDFVFKPNVILKTELMILSTLNWELNLITPFHYFNYFFTKLLSQDHQSKDLLFLRSSESLLTITKEISFTDYRQYIVAAATTMLVSSSSTSLESKLTREEIGNKFGLIPWWTSNDNDNVYSCYEKMLEIEEKKHKTPPPPNLAVSGGDRQPPGSGSGAKRRLSFDDSDQTSTSKRMHRL